MAQTVEASKRVTQRSTGRPHSSLVVQAWQRRSSTGTQPLEHWLSSTSSPSSHASPLSTIPSPQKGSAQSRRQASGVVSSLSAPLSQASLLSRMPSPQVGSSQLVRQASGSSPLVSPSITGLTRIDDAITTAGDLTARATSVGLGVVVLCAPRHRPRRCRGCHHHSERRGSYCGMHPRWCRCSTRQRRIPHPHNPRSHRHRWPGHSSYDKHRGPHLS